MTDAERKLVSRAADHLEAVWAQMMGLPQTKPPRLEVGASMVRQMAYELRAILDAEDERTRQPKEGV